MDFSEILVAFLAAGGGAAALAFAAFRFLSVSWLESKFEQRLEAHRHENAKELQRLSADVSGVLTATLRIQEKEFETLAACWEKANQAYGAAQSYTSQLQSYEDINRLSDALREEYVKSLDLLDAQKQEILGATDPTEELIKAVKLMKHNAAIKELREFNNFFLLSEVFLREEYVVRFKQMLDLLRDAINKKEIADQTGDHKLSVESSRVVTDEMLPLLKETAPMLRRKFFSGLER